MSRQWFEVKNPVCGCNADETRISSVIKAWRGNPKALKESQIVRHFRISDDAHFWHWKDNEVVNV